MPTTSVKDAHQQISAWTDVISNQVYVCAHAFFNSAWALGGTLTHEYFHLGGLVHGPEVPLSKKGDEHPMGQLHFFNDNGRKTGQSLYDGNDIANCHSLFGMNCRQEVCLVRCDAVQHS